MRTICQLVALMLGLVICGNASAYSPHFVDRTGSSPKFCKQYFSSGAQAQTRFEAAIIDYESISGTIECHLLLEGRVNQYDTNPTVSTTGPSAWIGDGQECFLWVITAQGASAAVCECWDVYIEYKIGGTWALQIPEHFYKATDDDVPFAWGVEVDGTAYGDVGLYSIEFHIPIVGQTTYDGTWTVDVSVKGSNGVSAYFLIGTLNENSNWVKDSSEFTTFKYTNNSRTQQNGWTYLQEGSDQTLDLKLEFKEGGTVIDTFYGEVWLNY